MGLLISRSNVTLDSCTGHQAGNAGDGTHACFSRFIKEGGAMRGGGSHLRIDGESPAGGRPGRRGGRGIERLYRLHCWRNPGSCGVFQVIFNEISAAEISRLDTMLQLELLTEFKVTPDDLRQPDGVRFGQIERDGKPLYRYRAKGYRIYFEVVDAGVRVHRVLHKNSLKDFLYRNGSKQDGAEDDVLAGSKSFWKLIEEGQKAKRA